MDDSWNQSSFWRAMTKTFTLGRLAGFEIRIHWSVFFYFLIALHLYSGDHTRGAEGSYALLAFMGTALLFLIVLIHELGHALAARRRGIEVEHIELSPLGGVASMRGFPTPTDELVVTLWGPAVHPMLLTLGALPYVLVERGLLDLGFFGNALIYQFIWINIGLLAFNLLPAFPLDGGRILRSLLARRMDASRATHIAATVGKVASVIFVIAGLVIFDRLQLLLVLIGIRNFFECERARQMAQHEGPYEKPGWMYGVAYEPKLEGLPGAEEEPRPGFIQRYLEAREEKRRAREAFDEAEVKRRVDTILERVSQLGMDGISDEERGFLQKASNLYRKQGS